MNSPRKYSLPPATPNIDSIQAHLAESTKEINFLYAVDEILNDFNSPLENIIRSLIDAASSYYTYPDICALLIELNSGEYKSENFRLTDLKLREVIRQNQEDFGHITVVYIKPVRSEKGVFTEVEKRLLRKLSGKLGVYLAVRKLKEEVDSLHQKKQSFLDQNDSESRVATQSWLESLHLTTTEATAFTQVKINYRKGEMICKQGAFSSYLMLVASGLTKNYLEGTQDRGFNFSIVRAFDFIGLSSLFGDSRYLFSGTALSPVTIYHIPVDLFENILEKNPLFAREIMKWYSRISRQHLARLACVGNKQALGRVADVLLYLSDKIFEDALITTIISRKDIAELAALSTESAVRILSGLKNDKIINIHTRGIEIVKRKFLEKLSYAG